MHRPVLIAATALALLAGCMSPPPAKSALPVKLLVRDGAMREVGAECSGTGAYQAIHPRAGFELKTAEGRFLARGILPAGQAVKSLEEQLNVPREPTFCQLEFVVTLEPAPSYRLHVGDLPPIELNRDPELGEQAPLVGLTT